MLSHLCPAVDLVLVQPHIPDPYLLHYQVFGSVLIRLPCCCLHSSPPCSSPSQTPPHIQEAAPGPQTENRLLLPPSAFLAHPHIHSVSSCAGSVGSFLIPVCLFTLVPLFQSQEQCTGHRRKVGPAVPSRSSRRRPRAPSSPSPQWVHLAIYEPRHEPSSCKCRKAPQPSVFSPKTPAPAVSSSRMFPQLVSGLPCLHIQDSSCPCFSLRAQVTAQ